MKKEISIISKEKENCSHIYINKLFDNSIMKFRLKCRICGLETTIPEIIITVPVPKLYNRVMD